jgi:hypothetical protein
MIDENTIIGFAGFLLVVFILLLDSYWKETKEHYYRALNKGINKRNRLLHIENYKRSLFMFRILALNMLLCLLSAIIIVFIPLDFSLIISLILLISASISLVIFLIRMILGHYYIIYLKPKELLKLIKKSH